MPAGSPWITSTDQLGVMPRELRYWHIYDEAYGPLAANPVSMCRLALPGRLGMFYVASSPIGALWETVMRFTVPDRHGYVRIDTTLLRDRRIVELELQRADVPLLDLRQPHRGRLFPLGSPGCLEVDALLRQPSHRATHPEAERMRADLAAIGIDEMPVVCWPSRQVHSETVYLAYQPPMQAAWWRAGTPITLDDRRGYRWVQDELARHGFRWAPLGSRDTPEGHEE